MYNKFVNFLKQHNLYDEEIFDFYWNNAFYNYSAGFTYLLWW